MKIKSFLLYSIIASCFTEHLFAESVTTNALQTITVEATRLDANIMETPQFVEVLTKQDIEASGSSDIMDALEKRGSIFLRHIGGANPAMTQVSMRGYGENSIGRVLILADGEVLNNFDMSSSDLSRFPLPSVRQIEVLHGPQTVIYGGNASAGMINIITDSNDYERKSYLEIQGGNWGSVGGSAGTKGGDEDSLISYYANGSWKHSDGYRDASGYDLYRLNGGIRKDFENETYFKLSSFFSSTEYELPGPLTYSEWKTDRRASDPDYSFYNYRQSTYGLNFSACGVIDENNEIKLESTLSYRRESFRAYHKTSRYTQDSPFENFAFSATPQYVNSSRLGDFDNVFTAGGTVRWDVRKGYNEYRYPTYTWKQKEDQARWTLGGFIRDEFFILENLSLFAGSRLERLMTRSESVKNPSQNDNLSAFETGLNFRPVKNAKLFTKLTRFYRSPFVDETCYTTGNIVEPERGWNIDIGGEIELPGGFSAGGSIYASETKNEIYYDPFKFDNLNLNGDVRREGIDLRLAWEKEKVAGFYLGYGFVDAETVSGEYDGKKMCAVPQHRIALNSKLYLWKDFFIRGGCHYTSGQYTISDFNNEFSKLKGYPLFSIGFQYECPYKPFEGLAISFDIDNLFDRDYCDYATYGANFYPAAGRSFTVTLRWTF